ncbi:MAG: GntR family transcriptional regulator, partial [Caldanaerobacter subterraneus]
EAIEARDTDAARKWAEKHIRNFQTEVVKDIKYFSYKE